MENKITLKQPWWGKIIAVVFFIFMLFIVYLMILDLQKNAQTMSPLLLLISPFLLIGIFWFAFWFLQLILIHEIELNNSEETLKIHKLFGWTSIKTKDIDRIVFWEQQNKGKGGIAYNPYFLHLILKNGRKETIRLSFNKDKNYYLNLFHNFFNQEIHYRYLRRFEHPNFSTWI